MTTFLNNPTQVKVGNKLYKINTSYRTAIECNLVAQDETISDYERAITIIYLLFGEEGMKDKHNHDKLLELAIKYLKCGNEDKIHDEVEENNMDFSQDINLIRASFKSDYGISLDDNMHWWDFFMYLNGLTENCILNRVRDLREIDTIKITDSKERKRIETLQKRFELKKKQKELTEIEKQSVNNFYKLTGLKGGER